MLVISNIDFLFIKRDPEREFDANEPDARPRLMGRMARDQTDGARGVEIEDLEDENPPGPCDAFTRAFGDKKLGFGFCDRLLDNFIDRDKIDEYEEIVKNVKQHRPYFTYW